MLTHSSIQGTDMHRLAKANFREGVDARDLPLYTPRDAARFLGIKPSTLNDWIHGHEYSDNRKAFDPLINVADEENSLLSFFNLAEAHVLKACRYKHRVKVEAIRRALDTIQERYPSEHPLISKDFFTNGKDLFLKTIRENENLSTAGQLNLKTVMDKFLVHIRRDKQFKADRIYPIIEGLPEDKVISIAHGISSGQPVIDGSGVPVWVVYGRYTAGEKKQSIAADFGITVSKIQRAIDFVEKRAA